MDGYDGPTLRSVRESANIALRAVARLARMSHGHLSKVERGEPGRPVTPAVLRAYEQACGVRLVSGAGHHQSEQGGGWRRGHLSEARRRTLNAKIAAVAVGGQLGDQVSRILDATGRILPPTRVGDTEVEVLEQAAAACTTLDLRLGGGACDQMARALLRWAIGLLGAEATDPVAVRLHAAGGTLAHRTGWAAFDADSHDVGRNLLTIALFSATRADDPDLRAHVLADLAAQYIHLGYAHDAAQVARLAEVDERVGPHVRMVTSAVKARAYALQGGTAACRQHIALAERAQAAAATSDTDGWVGTVATPAQLSAATGHALATLARRTNDARARAEAQQHLARAAIDLGPDRRRATALCLTQLATLHLEAGELDQGAEQARRALDVAAGIRSARLAEHLAALRTAASAHDAEPELAGLATTIDPGDTSGP